MPILNTESEVNAPAKRGSIPEATIMAISSLLLSFVTVPSIFCLIGYGSGIVSVMLTVLVYVKYRKGSATLSDVIVALTGAIVSIFVMVAYTMLFISNMPAP